MGRACLLIVLACAQLAQGSIYWSKDRLEDLDTLTPPLVTAPNRMEKVYVTEYTEVLLTCEAYGNPLPTYQWLWNGEEIPTNNSYRYEDRENGILNITSFIAREEGYYQCLAKNEHGVSFSQVTELRKRVFPKFTNTGPVRSLTVNEGEGIALRCFDKPPASPPVIYSWYEKTGGRQTQIHVHNSNRLEVDVNGTLYITMAQMADEKDTYACAMSAGEFDVVSLARTPYIELSVNRNTVLEVAPSLLGTTGYISAEIGEEATLECFFSGKPRPTIVWKYGVTNAVIRNGTESNRFRMSSSGHKLRILRLRDSDEGKYICHASNARGDTDTTVFLNVTSRPRFKTDSPQVIVAPAGDNATFTCHAEGAFMELPLPPPVWSVNGQPLMGENGSTALQEDKFSLKEDGTGLTILNVSKSDRMSVQCQIDNSVGFAFGDGFLTVIDPLEVVSKPNDTIVLEPETPWLNLTVEASSDSCCPVLFIWSFNGEGLSRPDLYKHPYSYDLRDNVATLSIHLEGMEETEVEKVMGEYSCHVRHHAYAKNQTVTVSASMRKLKEPEKNKLEEPKAASLWWIGLVAGVLVLLMAIVAIILMIRYNYPRQEYLLEKEEKKHRLNPEQDLLDRSFEEI